MDLSEVLARQIQKEKAAEAKALGKAAKSKKSSSQAANVSTIEEQGEEEDEDLTSYKPGAVAQSGDDDELDEEAKMEDDDSDDSEEGSNSDAFSEDEGDDLEALEKLGGMVSQLGGSKKRSADDAQATTKEVDERELQRKKRRLMLLRERTEGLPEGEFSAGGSSGKLTIDSLLSTLDTAQASALKQSLKPLFASSKQSSTTVEDASNAIEAELYRLTADEKALLTRERRKEKSNPLKAPGALPAPLAPLHQAKIERQAAKEKQDEKIREWDETVKYMKGVNRDGEDDPQNRLDLKALNDSQGKGKGVTSAELVAKFNVSLEQPPSHAYHMANVYTLQPTNDMEQQMHALIASTGSGQRDLMATESTALMEALPNKSTEAADALDRARIAQLRLARELMFRAERKAKRVAKIKSRTFRKIAKKSRQRQALKDGEGALTFDEMVELDTMDGGNRAEEERERLETMRARERATLRHASGASGATAGGRWSKGLRGLDGMDDDMKEAIKTRQSKQELLRKKVLGQDSDEDSDVSLLSEDDGEPGEEEDLEDVKNRALEEMELVQNGTGAPGALSKGVMSMKFMQRAAKKNEERVDGMIEDFRMQVEGGSDDEPEIEQTAGKGGERVSQNPGRMVFGPSASRAGQAQSGVIEGQTLSQRAKKRLNSSKTSGNVSVNGLDHSPVSPAPLSAASSATLLDYNPFSTLTAQDRMQNGRPGPAQEVNPWLNPDAEDSRVRLSSKKNKQSITKDSVSTDKAVSRLQKTQGRSKEAITKAQADASVDIDVEHILSNEQLTAAAKINLLPSSPAPPTSPASKAQRQNREMAPPPSSAQAMKTGNGVVAASDSEDDDDELPDAVVNAQGPNAFKQRDLVARAFAGDNVVTDFVEMKRIEIERDAPKEEDLTLPGWGAWGGKGARKSQKQQKKKHVKHIPGIEASDRKDAKYDHVIISEKKDKKAAKYLTKDLPYPYTSVQQFEQKLAQPTGIEWNTRGTVKEMTTPRVLTKPGMIIEPVTRKM